MTDKIDLVYDKYRHLGKILRDERMTGFGATITRDLWEAVVEEHKKREAGDDQLRIFVFPGMITISGPRIYYGNVKDMYQTGNGSGLQVDEGVDPKTVGPICDKIAELIYQLQEVLDETRTPENP